MKPHGTINVVAVDSGTRGQIEFESEGDGQPVLNFEVEGQEVAVRQGSTVFFSRVFPAE